ncbi:MAG TPA: cytochrome D1 domain-containing protein [Burkholderiaceae bacterium]|nr:cytochrome D1 domain-containing protein [Burkholderiaceae bacterium]
MRPLAALAAALALWAAAPAAWSQYAIVLNSRDATVSLIDQQRFAEVARIDVGKEPHHLYPTPDGKRLIVGNAMSDDLHFLDPVTGQIKGRLRGIDDPYQMAFSPDNRWFVTAALRLDRVDVYSYDGDLPKLVRRIPVPKAPSHLWFSADSRYVFVTLQDSDEIAAIDLATQQLAWKLPVGKQPAGIIMTPDDRHLLVGIMGEDYVQVIDWRRQATVARIRTGKGAHNFRGMGDKRRMLVSNRVANTVSIIDMTSMQLLESFPVPGGPDCMELTADGRLLWVTSRFARQVTVVDMETRKVVQRVSVGRSPHGIFFVNRAPLL